MIQVGDSLPTLILHEYSDVESEGRSIGPNPVTLPDAALGKTIALFAVPGAFTRTCSARHLPGFVALANEFRRAGVDEIWCLSVNDAYVMGAWARDQNAVGKVRFLADGSGAFAKAAGLTLDLTHRGFGLRSNRYSMLIKDGKVVTLNLENAGALEVSDAQTLLSQALL